MIELYQFPQLSKYLRRSIPDRMVMEMLDREISSHELRPILLHFKDRDGNRLISSWYQRVQESNNGLFLASCFCQRNRFTNSVEAASHLFNEVRQIDGRESGLENSPASALSYFRRIPDWIGNRGLWLLLVDHVEQLMKVQKPLQVLGLPVMQTANVRIVYTTDSDETAEKFRQSGVRVVEVSGSSGRAENELVDQVLKSAGLQLPEEIVALIARKAGTDDPAFIRQLAGKLRIYGVSDESLSIINSIDLSAEV